MSSADIPSGTVVPVRIEDSKASAFIFVPDDAWNLGPDQTVHVTYVQNASASVVFDGARVRFYADVSPRHGLFSAAIDSGPAAVYTSYATAWERQQLLYTSPPLDPGAHTLHLRSLTAGAPFEVDYVEYEPVVRSLTSINSTTPLASVETSAATPAESTHIGKELAAIIILAVLVLLLAFPTLLFLRSRCTRAVRPLPAPPGGTALPHIDAREAKLSMLSRFA